MAARDHIVHPPPRAARPAFATEPLRDAVAIGSVTRDSARIWLRSERPGHVRVACRPERAGSADGGQVVEATIAPDAPTDGTLCVEVKGLQAGTAYDVEVAHLDHDEMLARGHFETAPAGPDSAPDRFSIAIMSCNQPFTDEGSRAAAGAQMLEAAQHCLGTHATKAVLMLGDQMYTDYPPGHSLFAADYFEAIYPHAAGRRIDECAAHEVRALLQERYRYFWNFEGWRALLAHYPCLPIIDDHDIVDNWGCDPAHETATWSEYFEGARAAYYDYQGSRVSDEHDAREDFDHSFEYGPLAGYMLDLRTNRRAGDRARIYSDGQFENLKRFLAAQAEKQIVILALSVPAVHLPRWAARTGQALTLSRNEDFSDRWSTAGHVEDRDRLLAMLHDHQRRHPEQRVVLVSGDIHIACAHAIAWEDGTTPLYQFVASGITNQVGPVTQAASRFSILANRHLKLENPALAADVHLLPGTPQCNKNPYTKLNLGLLELNRDTTGRYALRYNIFGHAGSQPKCVYRTDWL